MNQFARVTFFALAGLLNSSLFFLVGCGAPNEDSSDWPVRTFENQVGTRFTPVKSFSFEAPDIKEIPLDYAPSANAIWGSIGRDDKGNLYLGASTHSGPGGTAFLYKYDPSSSTLEPQGDVLGQLKRLGLYESGMGQNKLHSKVYQADDGYIYFSSFDEQGEDSDTNPTWGGHLWRKKSDDLNWQHLLATPEALMAVNLSGNYVYALGYWNHVLYQFNTETQAVTQVVIGSTPGHISRNFLVDPMGHAYVPMVTTKSSGETTVFLNEYDTQLKLVGSYPMPSYQHKSMKKHHGIVGYASMENGDIVFTTADGGLYELNVYAGADGKLDYKGTMHPDGSAYIPSLFPIDGQGLVAGVGRASSKKGYEWIIYELQTRFGVAYKLDTSSLRSSLLYGTLTKDDVGNFYLVGRAGKTGGEGFRPVLLVIPVNSLWSSQ